MATFTTVRQLKSKLPNVTIHLVHGTDQGMSETPNFIDVVGSTKQSVQAAIDLGGDYHREGETHVVTFLNDTANPTHTTGPGPPTGPQEDHMTGKTGRSGGARAGSGRPPQSWRLREGDKMAAFETFDGKPVGTGRLATIEIIKRNLLIIRLDDGTEIKLVR